MSGISGLGGHLVPFLHDAGHDVIGLSRDPNRVRVDARCVRADATRGLGLDEAMDGVDVAYYLIHTFEQQNTEGFEVGDRRAATNVATAAERAGVSRIVYLGFPPAEDPARTSAHTRSRLEVEDILLGHVPNSVAVRAASIPSPRSRSFRVLLDVLARYPVFPLPPWRVHRTRPIDVRDLFAALVVAGTVPELGGRRLTVGGPTTVSWGDLLRSAVARLPGRTALPSLPVNPPRAVVRLLTAAAGGNPALMGPPFDTLSMGHVATSENDIELFGITPRSLDVALDHAVAEYLEGSWRDAEGTPSELVGRRRSDSRPGR